MMFMTCLAALAGLLVFGALIDIESRRLPNWLTGAVAGLYGLYVIVSPEPVDWPGAFAVAGLVFGLGFVAFAFKVMGGGDVKLMAGLALWAGTAHIGAFLFVTSLAGGALAVIMLLQRRWAGLFPQFSFWPPLSNLTAGKIADPFSVSAVEHADTTSLPYGVAIAAGGFAIIFALLQL